MASSTYALVVHTLIGLEPDPRARRNSRSGRRCCASLVVAPEVRAADVRNLHAYVRGGRQSTSLGKGRRGLTGPLLL